MVSFEYQHMSDQLHSVLTASPGEYDEEKIMENLVTEFGVRDLDDIPSGAFWAAVIRGSL